MQNKKNTSKYAYALMALATITTLATAVPALADNTNTTTPPANAPAWGERMGGGVGGRMMKPGVFGTVKSVSGNIITVNETKGKFPPGKGETNSNTTETTTTYTVDATNAKITKNNVAGTISSILVGDTIMAQGTLTGTNLVATTIRDGVMMKKTGDKNGQTDQNQTSPITGNGQPIIAGTVSTISGSTLTITNKSNVVYTVDATNAKIAQGSNTIAIGGITVGDMVVVQGTVNGTSVVASSVIDQKVASTTTTQPSKGFFGSIGAFFSHLFGF